VSGLHTTAMGEGGSRIVFLHGLFGQGRNWTTIGRALSDAHRVLLVDLPDHGRSPWTDRIDYAGMADEVARLLAAGDTVVGHSMGGKVAMMTALRHREVVERLVVADMSPVTYAGGTEFARFVAAMRGLDLGALSSREDADRALAPAVPDPSVRAFLLQNLRRDLGSGDGGWRWQMNLEVLGRDLDVLTAWPAEDLAGVPAYDGPVLWLAGERSRYVTAEYAEEMRRWFPHHRKVVIKNAGHWLHSEQPEVFTELVRRFSAGPGL
jgi:esterase